MCGTEIDVRLIAGMDVAATIAQFRTDETTFDAAGRHHDRGHTMFTSIVVRTGVRWVAVTAVGEARPWKRAGCLTQYAVVAGGPSLLQSAPESPGGTALPTRNFAFLSVHDAQLVQLGALAERYFRELRRREIS